MDKEITQNKQVVVIVNPNSGISSKRRVVSKIISYVNTERYDLTICYTSFPGHATKIACEAVDKGVAIVVAVGGDGTVNEVAKALVWSNTALGIVPCGSGNGLARHLGIPLNVRKAIEVINRGNTDTIDTMEVNGDSCFCTAGVGYEAYVGAEYAKEKRRGLITYARKAISGWLRYEPQEYILEVGDQVLIRKALSITCANANQWGNGFHIAPKASLKDGFFDVTITYPFGIVNAIAMPSQILGYSFDKNPKVESFKAKQLVIKRRRTNNLLHIDGETLCMEDDLIVNICEDSLKVICDPVSGVRNR